MAKQTKYHIGIEIDKLTNSNYMGHIKEPDGIDFVVDPTPLTATDRKMISAIIAYYKATGRKMSLKKLVPPKRDGQKIHTHSLPAMARAV